MNPQLHISKDPVAVALEFAEMLVALAGQKEKLHVALAGGSTPQLLFDKLASDFIGRIDWRQIQFYWGDERCVPPGHAESNYRMTKKHLFDHINIPADNIHRIRGEKDPLQEAVRYGEVVNSTLPSKNGLPCFDLIMLGLGTDGHTASIFPHEMTLLEQKETCAVATHPDSGQKRVSLTGPVINNADQVAFLVTGSSKQVKVMEIIRKTGNWKGYPASYISPTHGELHWFMDRAAAG